MRVESRPKPRSPVEIERELETQLDKLLLRQLASPSAETGGVVENKYDFSSKQFVSKVAKIKRSPKNSDTAPNSLHFQIQTLESHLHQAQQ